jgi:hypothetical protein
MLLQPLHLQEEVPSTRWKELQAHWRHVSEGVMYKSFPFWYCYSSLGGYDEWIMEFEFDNHKIVGGGNLLYSSYWETKLVKEGNIKIDLNEITFYDCILLFHQTPLHLAVIQNQPETVKTLLTIGANPNSVTRQGDSPLHLAVSASYNDCISELLSVSNYVRYSNCIDCNLTNYNGESKFCYESLRSQLLFTSHFACRIL